MTMKLGDYLTDSDAKSPSAAPVAQYLRVSAPSESSNDVRSSNDMRPSNDMAPSNDMVSSADVPDNANDRVTTNVPVEPIETDKSDLSSSDGSTSADSSSETVTDSAQTTVVPESLGENDTTLEPETSEETDPAAAPETSEETDTTSTNETSEKTESAAAPETSEETDTTSTTETIEETDTSAMPETSGEIDITAETSSTIDDQMVDIGVNDALTSKNITEIIDEIFDYTGTFSSFSSSSSSSSFAPQITTDNDVFAATVSEPSDDPIEINVNTDAGVLPNGAETTNEMRNLYGSNDVFIHTSLCLLCIFFLSLR